MFLNSIAHYLPSIEISNDYFLDKNGLTDEWIYTRTGIKKRQKAEPHENANTMALDAVKNLLMSIFYKTQIFVLNYLNMLIGLPFHNYGLMVN